jgi:anti-sigma regulatory factor (Ser/Thr protein kinase)
VIRHQVELILRVWTMEALYEDVGLIVTELAANAVQHCGGGTFGVSVLRIDRGVRISVSDSCTNPPRRRIVPLSEECGRGMLIVDSLADEWGVKQLLTGKTVWADVLFSYA